MSEIRKTTLEEAGKLLTDALLTYEKEINEGYLRSGEKEFSVSMKLGIAPSEADGDFDLKASIDFTKDKVKDTFTRKIRSTPLFEVEKCCGGYDKPTDCFKCLSKKAVMVVDGKKLPYQAVNEGAVPDGAWYQIRPCAAFADQHTMDHAVIMANFPVGKVLPINKKNKKAK